MRRLEVLRKLLIEKIGASEGIRTLDIHLGKVTLYQTELRSPQSRLGQTTGVTGESKRVFWLRYGGDSGVGP